MALSEKWEALLGPGTGDAPAGMTLASAAPPGGGGPGGQADLKVMHGPWTSASGVAGELHTTSASALTELATASEGVSAGTEGFTGTTALTEVLTSWQKRLTSVREESSRLKGSLLSAAKEFGEQEVRTEQSFGAVKKK
ncbi:MULTISPECIES: hypothetical protein [unclassified Streptomyces]|uniref:hypothetical protein n=1 Tax=unclassified Streptomyces TaxID=2593676 RepID=UPI0033B24908